MHITHIGRGHISSDVYIGDNTYICKSLFDGETYFGQGRKIDNLVQVSHNIYVGKHAVITAQVMICGLAIIEDKARLSSHVSVLNKATIGKGAKVGFGSVATKNVAPYTLAYGSPGKAHK